MRPFRRGKLAEVLDERDHRRVIFLVAKAMMHSEDHVLVGSRIRDPATWIVWARFELVPAEVPPGLPPSESGYRARDYLLDGIWFKREVQRWTWLNSKKSKPPELEDLRAVIVSYRGRLSWEELDQALDQR